MAEKLEGSASTNVYRCSKCGLPCEVVSGDAVPLPLSSAWPKSACCKASADPVKEAGR